MFQNGSLLIPLKFVKGSLRNGPFGFDRFYIFDKEDHSFKLLYESKFNLENKYRYMGLGHPAEPIEDTYINSEFKYSDTIGYIKYIEETVNYVNVSRLPNSSCDKIVYDSIITKTIPLWEMAVEKFGIDPS